MIQDILAERRASGIAKKKQYLKNPFRISLTVVDVVGAIEKTGESHSYVLLVVAPFS